MPVFIWPGPCMLRVGTWLLNLGPTYGVRWGNADQLDTNWGPYSTRPNFPQFHRHVSAWEIRSPIFSPVWLVHCTFLILPIVSGRASKRSRPSQQIVDKIRPTMGVFVGRMSPCVKQHFTSRSMDIPFVPVKSKHQLGDFVGPFGGVEHSKKNSARIPSSARDGNIWILVVPMNLNRIRYLVYCKAQFGCTAEPYRKPYIHINPHFI